MLLGLLLGSLSRGCLRRTTRVQIAIANWWEAHGGYGWRPERYRHWCFFGLLSLVWKMVLWNKKGLLEAEPWKPPALPVGAREMAYEFLRRILVLKIQDAVWKLLSLEKRGDMQTSEVNQHDFEENSKTHKQIVQKLYRIPAKYNFCTILGLQDWSSSFLDLTRLKIQFLYN